MEQDVLTLSWSYSKLQKQIVSPLTNGSIIPTNLLNTYFLRYDAFYSKRRNCNHLEAEYTDYVNLFESELTTEQAVIKLK